MKSTRFYTIATDLLHIFAILPIRLKLLSLFLSITFFLSAVLDFMSLIFVGLFVKILSTHGSTSISNFDASYALQFASTTLEMFPSKLYYPLIYIVILSSVAFRAFTLIFKPYVVKELSAEYGYRLVNTFTSMPIVSFGQISLSEFRTVLTEDLSSLINNAVRPTLALSSSLFALIAACIAAYFASPKLFLALTLTSCFCYLLYNMLYFNRMSLYLSNVMPFLERSKSSLLEYIYHSIDLIKLYGKSFDVEKSFSQLNSKRDAMSGVQNIVVSFPRLMLEFLMMSIFIAIGSFYLFYSPSQATYQSADLVVLFLSLTKAASSFQLIFHNFGTLFTNSRQLHTVSTMF